MTRRGRARERKKKRKRKEILREKFKEMRGNSEKLI